jgi:hypothetical protein
MLKGGPPWLAVAAAILSIVVISAIAFVQMRKVEADANATSNAANERANEWTNADKEEFKRLMDARGR